MPTLTGSLDGIDRRVRVLGPAYQRELLAIIPARRDRPWLRVYLEHEQRRILVLAGRVEG